MKAKYIQLVIFAWLLACCSSTQKMNHLSASALHPIGRYQLTHKQHLELVSSAAHFGFTFTGDRCEIEAYATPWNHSYLQYELDGIYKGRIKVGGDTPTTISIKASAGGTHTVWVYKTTEATTGPVFITQITGEQLQALDQPSTPIIEFIGNSITCGALSDPSEIPCGSGIYIDQHNAYQAYGPRVARALKTEFILSSVSGIGMYRTWNQDGPSMPDVYDRLDFHTDSIGWDHNRFTPLIVSVELGTNDLSLGDGLHPRPPFDSSIFIKQYTQFVQKIKIYYPAARIALLSSPVTEGNDRTLLENCLSSVKKVIDALHPSDPPVALHFFQPMKARGCNGHPSVEDHETMAKELIPFFKGLL
ncbi:MAG: hypothetical protein JST68_25000 [Bacteroidetes bacterium]|nr:hypothetical protein [Bacteroidota bacterium]